MDRFRALRGGLVLVCLLAFPIGRARAQGPEDPAPADSLFRTIAALDSAVFDAYNRCDLDRLGQFFTDDLEFYHDQTGLSRSRQALIDGVRQNVCGRVRRDLVPGTLEVSPLRGYGAVESGLHLFCDPAEYRRCEDGTSGIGKFVMLWQHEGGVWRISRVISYDHVSSHQRAAVEAGDGSFERRRMRPYP